MPFYVYSILLDKLIMKIGRCGGGSLKVSFSLNILIYTRQYNLGIPKVTSVLSNINGFKFYVDYYYSLFCMENSEHSIAEATSHTQNYWI